MHTIHVHTHIEMENEKETKRDQGRRRRQQKSFTQWAIPEMVMINVPSMFYIYAMQLN